MVQNSVGSDEKNEMEKTNRKICGAKTRSGKPCRTYPMANGRCRIHGGKSLKGIASPRFKTGKYSKYLPEKVRTRYLATIVDKDLISLRDEIALNDVYLIELLESMKSGEVSQAETKLWRRIGRSMDLKRRLVNAEFKRLAAMKQFITAEEAYALIVRISNIIKTHISDKQILGAIMRDIDALLDKNKGDES